MTDVPSSTLYASIQRHIDLPEYDDEVSLRESIDAVETGEAISNWVGKDEFCATNQDETGVIELKSLWMLKSSQEEDLLAHSQSSKLLPSPNSQSLMNRPDTEIVELIEENENEIIYSHQKDNLIENASSINLRRDDSIIIIDDDEDGEESEEKFISKYTSPSMKRTSNPIDQSKIPELQDPESLCYESSSICLLETCALEPSNEEIMKIIDAPAESAQEPTPPLLSQSFNLSFSKSISPFEQVKLEVPSKNLKRKNTEEDIVLLHSKQSFKRALTMSEGCQDQITKNKRNSSVKDDVSIEDGEDNWMNVNDLQKKRRKFKQLTLIPAHSGKMK